MWIANLEAVDVQQGVQLDERERAVTPKELLGGAPERLTPELHGLHGQRGQPQATGLRGPAVATVVSEGPEGLVDLERLVDHGPAGLQPLGGLVVERVEPVDQLLTFGVDQLADAGAETGGVARRDEGLGPASREGRGEGTIGACVHGRASR